MSQFKDLRQSPAPKFPRKYRVAEGNVEAAGGRKQILKIKKTDCINTCSIFLRTSYIFGIVWPEV